MTRRALKTIGTLALAVALVAVVALVVGPRLLSPTNDGFAGASPSLSPTPTPAAQPSPPATSGPKIAGCFDPAAPAEPVVFTNPDGPPGGEREEGYPFVEAARALPTFGGVWVSEFRQQFHIALTCDVDGAIAQIGHLVPRTQELHFHLVQYTYAELEEIRDRMFAERDALMAEGIFLSYGGIDERANRVNAGIDPLNDTIAEQLRQRYGEAIEFEHVPRPAAPATVPPGGREIVEAVARPTTDEPMVTCGGSAFPASLLDDPDAEGVPDDMVEDFSAVVQFWRAEFPGLERLQWKLIHRDGESAEFIARQRDAWISLTLRRDTAGWTPSGAGDCRPTPAFEDAGRATWWLDPAYAAPGPETAELHILVMEQACASGQPAFGRIAAPVAVYEPDTLTLTVGVRGVGMATCPSNPPTPATVILPAPLGERVLLDGGRHPPAPPQPDY
jgi:hypothetical protein